MKIFRLKGVDEDWIRKITNGIDGRQIDLIDLERAARGLSRLSTVYDIPLQDIKSNMENSPTLSQGSNLDLPRTLRVMSRVIHAIFNSVQGIC